MHCTYIETSGRVYAAAATFVAPGYDQLGAFRWCAYRCQFTAAIKGSNFIDPEDGNPGVWWYSRQLHLNLVGVPEAPYTLALHNSYVFAYKDAQVCLQGPPALQDKRVLFAGRNACTAPSASIASYIPPQSSRHS